VADLTVPRFDSNEIAKAADFNYGEEREIGNLNVLLGELLGEVSNDVVIKGLTVQERATPSMNIDITGGLGFCSSTGELAHSGSLFGPVSIVNGGTSDRIDTLEIRIKETSFDPQQRAYKDPATGNVSYQSFDTKKRYEIEVQVIQGTEGSGVAPDHTPGWIKLAEIHVAAGESTAIYNSDIKNCTATFDGDTTTDWTAEQSATFRLKTLPQIKEILRTKHLENGDHKDDVIKDKHIDWGTGTGQVSAEDMPVADPGNHFDQTNVEGVLREIIEDLASTASGEGASKIGIEDADGLFDAANVEEALQEIYSNPLKHLPVGTVMMFDGAGWVDNETIPGWYACISENAGVGCPDMVDRFVMGRVVTSTGGTGGSNTHTISTSELPPHIHAIDHDHASFTSGSNSVGHTHSVTIGSHSHTALYLRNSGTGGGNTTTHPYVSISSHSASYLEKQRGDRIFGRYGSDYGFITSTTDLGTKTSGTQSANHTHTINVPYYTGNSGNGGFANDSIDMRPAYYTMIFIRKCA